jgi:hypothetical protein
MATDWLQPIDRFGYNAVGTAPDHAGCHVVPVGPSLTEAHSRRPGIPTSLTPPPHTRDETPLDCPPARQAARSLPSWLPSHLPSRPPLAAPPRSRAPASPARLQLPPPAVPPPAAATPSMLTEATGAAVLACFLGLRVRLGFCFFLHPVRP